MHPEIKLVCFDLDQTLINQNSWYELSLALGVPAELDRQLYNEFKAGSITYEQWNDRVIEEYMKHENATRKGITESLCGYTYNEGAREAVKHLQQSGYEVVLISGSIDIIVDHVAKDLGIRYAKANNTFLFDENDRLKGVHAHGDDTIAKAQHLESFCDLLGVKMHECACIGDGENDVEMFRRTRKGITFTGSRIESDAWKIVDSLQDIPQLLD
ncbi:MAG: HAD family phosphatase [Patescibacteria group bacterium]